MNQQLIDILNSGIFLEKSQATLLRKTSFEDLKKIGNPVISNSVETEKLTWPNESVLNGLNVNLEVIYTKGLFGKNKKLECAFSFISEESLNKTKSKLENDLGPAKFKESGNEYRYYWKLDFCTLILHRKDRFGFYYQVEFKY